MVTEVISNLVLNLRNYVKYKFVLRGAKVVCGHFKLTFPAIISPGFIRRRLVGFSFRHIVCEFKTNKRGIRSEKVRNLLRSKTLFHLSSRGTRRNSTRFQG